VSLVIASIGLPLIPDQIVSTYELSIEEVVSSGPDRLIVFEGSEEKLAQLTVGLLERLGIGKPPWDRDEDEEYYVTPTSTSNQLGTGVKTAPQPMRTVAPARENWDDDNWEEDRRPMREPLRQRQPEPVYDDEPEEENWNDNEDEYEDAAYEEVADEEEVSYVEYRQPEYQPVEVAEVMGDAWEDDDNPEPLNLPERKRVIEYEEEPGY
jgi:hypothetical protein